jgi:hypothetical protein
MHRTKSLRISLSVLLVLGLVACAGWPVEPPELNQCQFNITKESPLGAFFCQNTKTFKRTKRELNDPRMKGAQCLDPEDYKKAEKWAGEIKKHLD